MHTYGANVVIHVDEDLSDSDIIYMEQNLSAVDGVVSACVHERARHLWVIDYDPRQINSRELLHRIQDSGVQAELVGGV